MNYRKTALALAAVTAIAAPAAAFADKGGVPNEHASENALTHATGLSQGVGPAKGVVHSFPTRRSSDLKSVV